MRAIIGGTKLFIFLLSALFTIAYQSIVLLLTKGPFALVYPRAYHAFLCRLAGIKVIVEGEIETGSHMVYIGNHISYFDVQVIGSLVKGSFVAKKEVERWPLFGILGKMGRTLYVSRTPADAAKETKVMIDRLEEGLPLIVFAEGTSTDGTKVLPFKSSFFEIFLNRNIRLQPFTISILEMDQEIAANQIVRDRYAWHGDMTLEPHLWLLFKSKGGVIKVTFQKSISSVDYYDRKQLSVDTHNAVAKGLDLSVMGQ